MRSASEDPVIGPSGEGAKGPAEGRPSDGPPPGGSPPESRSPVGGPPVGRPGGQEPRGTPHDGRLPASIRFLLRLIYPEELRDEAEGDLLERQTAWRWEKGPFYARRRLWREVILMAGWRWVGSRRQAKEVRKRGAPRGTGEKDWRTAQLFQDGRFALRRLAKNPLSSMVAVFLLAIGIGGNATVFTVVDKTLRKPPPLIQNPHELVGLDWSLGGGSGVVFGYYDYEFYQDQGEVFSEVLAYGGFSGSQGRRTDQGGGEVVVGRGTEVEQAGAWVVSGNYFRVLGVAMGLGPGFSPEVQTGEATTSEVVLSHGYWARSFGSDPSILDRPVYLNGVPFRVAGVTPREFRGVNPGEPVPDLFIPILSAEAISLGFNAQLYRYQPDGSPSASRFLRLVARLEPGVDMDEARAAAEVLQGRWEDEFSTWSEVVYGEPYQLRVRPEFNMASFESRLLRRQLYFLWFVMGAVFLIACTNLAILLLASASGREREMGIRASLGAGRRRLLSQLVTESLVLSVLGGAAGLGVAYLAPEAITATLSMNIQASIAPDATVVAFALFLSTVAAVLFGTAPAWILSKVNVGTLLQRPGQGKTRARFRGGLVVSQTALSILLLIGGGLLARSVQELQRVDLGFDPDRRLILGVLLDNNGYSDEEGSAFVLAALDRLAQVPGVRSVTTTNRIPFRGSNTWTFTAQGTDFAESGLPSRFNLAGPGYFQTMDISVVSGRAFTRDDVFGSPVVAVVNEVFADRVWPGENPLGKTLDFANQPVQVVGVAETAVYNSVTESPGTHIYFPSLQFYQGRQNFVVATEPPTATMVDPATDALREMDANLGIVPTTLDGLVNQQIESFRIWASLISVVALVALLLALVGLYGVQAYLVSRRTKEIGIRMALGAERGTLVGGVLKSGMIMGGLGAVIGIVAALAMGRLIRGALFGVAPNDPLVFAVVPILLLMACAAATLVPALRASSINPVEALSEE